MNDVIDPEIELQPLDDKIEPKPDLVLMVAKMYDLPKSRIQVVHLHDNKYRVHTMKHKQVLDSTWLVIDKSHYVVYDNDEIISANPEFPKN